MADPAIHRHGKCDRRPCAAPHARHRLPIHKRQYWGRTSSTDPGAEARRSGQMATNHDVETVGPARGRSEVTKVVVASLIGTTIEWYDFFLYGTAAALVFNKLFFPGSDPLVGTMLAFTTYALGFLAR